MADTEFHFDGQPTTTEATAAMVGASETLTKNGGTIQFLTAAAQSGPCGLTFTPVSTFQCCGRFAYAATATSFGFHGIMTCPTLTTNGQQYIPFTIRGSAGRILQCQMYRTGGVNKVMINTSADGFGTIPPTWGYVNAAGGATDLELTGGTKYRIELYGTASATGTFDLRIYPVTGATTTPLNEYTDVTNGTGSHQTSVNTGTVGATHVDIGRVDTAATTIPISWDEVILRDGSATEYGVYSIPAIALYPETGTVTATGWTKTGAASNASVLGDSDNATYLSSGDNPSGSGSGAVITGAMTPINTPGSDLVVTVRCSKAGATTGTLQGVLKTADGVTTLATSASVNVPDTEGNISVTFTAASISAVTASQWASGLTMQLNATAAA